MTDLNTMIHRSRGRLNISYISLDEFSLNRDLSLGFGPSTLLILQCMLSPVSSSDRPDSSPNPRDRPSCQRET